MSRRNRLGQFETMKPQRPGRVKHGKRFGFYGEHVRRGEATR